jgi:hypothetical protein
LSLRSNAVRFLLFGMYSGVHRPQRLRTRRNSNPRNPKLSPCSRSTVRLCSAKIPSEPQAAIFSSQYSWCKPGQDHEVTEGGQCFENSPKAVKHGRRAGQGGRHERSASHIVMSCRISILVSGCNICGAHRSRPHKDPPNSSASRPDRVHRLTA